MDEFIMHEITKTPETEGLGLEFKPGDPHYRAYVGPPENYDLVSAMVFNLLTCVGLRQHHRVLDIGCGSLRNGRLLIPYLNSGNYYGVEPNEWLVRDGILNEVGEDLIRIKRPVFSFKDSLEEFESPLNLDYAFAQSIFSHCGLDLIQQWLEQMLFHLKDSGVLFATFFTNKKEDFKGSGWVYPGLSVYKRETLNELARECGFHFEILNWAHPSKQRWAMFAREKYEDNLIVDGVPSWNTMLKKQEKKKK